MDKYEHRRQCLIGLIEAKYKGSSAAFSRAAGISADYVSRLRYPEGKKHKKNMGEDIESKISEIHPDWLSLTKDENSNVIQLPSIKSIPKATQSDDLTINQYHDVRGSMGGGLLLNGQRGIISGWKVTAEWATHNIPSNTGKENLCIVTGFGNSMKGMFNSGDPILIDIGVKEVKYEGVYFFRINDEGFIKLLQRIPGDGLRVISKNPDYETWTITPDMDFEIFGRVLKVWKSEEF